MKKNKEQMLTSVTCSHRNVGFGHLTSISTREEPIFSADPNGGREVDSPPITNQKSTFQDPSSHLISHREFPARVILVLLAKRIGIPFQRYLEAAAAAQIPSEIQIGKSWNSQSPILLYVNKFMKEQHVCARSMRDHAVGKRNCCHCRLIG
jgi:hypothetical protein